MKKVIITQGIAHSLTVKERDLPSLENGAEWLCTLYNEATNKRFFATKSTDLGVVTFKWEAGATLDATTGVVTLTDDPNSTASMCEGVYKLEFIASDLSNNGFCDDGIYEVKAGSILASVQS